MNLASGQFGIGFRNFSPPTRSPHLSASGVGTGYSATIDCWVRVVWRVAMTLRSLLAHEQSNRAMIAIAVKKVMSFIVEWFWE